MKPETAAGVRVDTLHQQDPPTYLGDLAKNQLAVRGPVRANDPRALNQLHNRMEKFAPLGSETDRATAPSNFVSGVFAIAATTLAAVTLPVPAFAVASVGLLARSYVSQRAEMRKKLLASNKDSVNAFQRMKAARTSRAEAKTQGLAFSLKSCSKIMAWRQVRISAASIPLLTAIGLGIGSAAGTMGLSLVGIAAVAAISLAVSLAAQALAASKADKAALEAEVQQEALQQYSLGLPTHGENGEILPHSDNENIKEVPEARRAYLVDKVVRELNRNPAIVAPPPATIDRAPSTDDDQYSLTLDEDGAILPNPRPVNIIGNPDNLVPDDGFITFEGEQYGDPVGDDPDPQVGALPAGAFPVGALIGGAVQSVVSDHSSAGARGNASSVGTVASERTQKPFRGGFFKSLQVFARSHTRLLGFGMNPFKEPSENDLVSYRNAVHRSNQVANRFTDNGKRFGAYVGAGAGAFGAVGAAGIWLKHGSDQDFEFDGAHRLFGPLGGILSAISSCYSLFASSDVKPVELSDKLNSTLQPRRYQASPEQLDRVNLIKSWGKCKPSLNERRKAAGINVATAAALTALTVASIPAGGIPIAIVGFVAIGTAVANMASSTYLAGWRYNKAVIKQKCFDDCVKLAAQGRLFTGREYTPEARNKLKSWANPKGGPLSFKEVRLEALDAERHINKLRSQLLIR